VNSHEIVIYRNLFYRKLAGLQFLLMGLIMLGICINMGFIQIMRWDVFRPTYFETDKFGIILPQHSLNDPVYTNQQVEQWTTDKLNQLLSLNFATHNAVLNSAASYFNPIGYIQYIAAIHKSRILEALNTHKYVSVIEIVEPVKVARALLLDGEKTAGWVLKGKYQVQYFNNKNIKNPFVQELDLTILVQRESFSLYQDGISIRTIIA